MKIFLGIAIASLLALPSFIFATDYTSNSFKVKDPVIGGILSGGSASFGLGASLFQPAIGHSTSSSFQLFSGFQYYFKADPNTLTATAGAAQVSLSWTVPRTYLGVVISGYEVGTGTASGSYTFESVGNVTSFTKSLNAGTLYYFKIRTLTPDGQYLVYSNEASATPTSPVTPPPNPGPSPGPSGPPPIPPDNSPNSAEFSGRAYPNSKVSLLKDGQLVASTIAGPDSNFFIGVKDLGGGSYIFGVNGEDKDGRKSPLLTFPVTLTIGTTTKISGIFLAPTIDVDKSVVKKGDNIAIFGQAIPDGTVTISVHSNPEFFEQIKADAGGVYLHNFDTTPLDLGSHQTKSKVASTTDISPYGNIVAFSVGSENVGPVLNKCGRADLNCDGRVDLIDFSILAYWYHRKNFPAKVDLNNDGQIDLTDFSIMAFYWTS